MDIMGSWVGIAYARCDACRSEAHFRWDRESGKFIGLPKEVPCFVWDNPEGDPLHLCLEHISLAANQLKQFLENILQTGCSPDL